MEKSKGWESNPGETNCFFRTKYFCKANKTNRNTTVQSVRSNKKVWHIQMKWFSIDICKIHFNPLFDCRIYFERLDHCATGAEGTKLHYKAGVKTDALQPPVSFIPTIEIDGSQHKQGTILKDFIGEICRIYTEKHLTPGQKIANCPWNNENSWDIVLRIDNLMKLLCITHNCRCFNFNCDDRNLCICYFPICVLPRIVKR